jgi:hypothetical protein
MDLLHSVIFTVEGQIKVTLINDVFLKSIIYFGGRQCDHAMGAKTA